jgi:hypothetical protein
MKFANAFSVRERVVDLILGVTPGWDSRTLSALGNEWVDLILGCYPRLGFANAFSVAGSELILGCYPPGWDSRTPSPFGFANAFAVWIRSLTLVRGTKLADNLQQTS